ncbi:MAG: phage holin family protein [Acidimicrobiales bacterium]
MDTGPNASTTPQSEPVSTTPPRTIPSAASLTGGDWPAQAADAIVNAVEAVRDRTTTPIMKIARGLVFGVFAGAIIITVIVLATIGVVRLLDEALPSEVWLPYLILGVLFTLVGAFLFRRRNAPTPAPGAKSSSR